MLKVKKSKAYINDLAKADQEKGRVSNELHDLVRGVALKQFNRFLVEEEDKIGMLGLALHNALVKYQYGRGDFALVVHIYARREAEHYYHEFKHCVRFPMHRKDAIKNSRTIYPDGVKYIHNDRDNALNERNYWDTLGFTEDFTDDIGPSEIDVAVTRLSDKYQQIYKMKYTDELSKQDIAECLGVSTRTVGARIETLHKKMRSHICKMRQKELI